MTQEYDSRSPLSPPPRQTGPNTPARMTPKAKGGTKNKKIANNFVALGSAAIISVYGLGYMRTQSTSASLTADTPIVAIATTAPTATDAASSQIAAYQSPLLPPTVAATPATATTPATAATATTAAITSNAPTAVATVPATAEPITATRVPATSTRAPAATSASVASTATFKDGSYTGTGTSRHGNITAAVVIQGGKIVSANITQCGTRYPCAQIAALPGQVVARQSAPVDLVSGATESSRAYQGAIQNALAKATASA